MQNSTVVAILLGAAIVLCIYKLLLGLGILAVLLLALIGVPMAPAVGYWNWAIFERLFPNVLNFWLSGRGSYLERTARTRTCWCVPRPCVGSDCNAWRWNRSIFSWRGMLSKRRGRCDTSAYRDIKLR